MRNYSITTFLAAIMKKAATIVLVVGLLTITFLEFRHYQELRKQYPGDKTHAEDLLLVSVPRGERRKVELPDGTVAWLNASSILTYPRNMEAGERNVEVTGEAFFQVATIASRPFRVRARDMLVEVLGTSFNLRNYPEETFTRAIVSEGTIRVTHNEEQVLLRPGEEADVESCKIEGPALTMHSGVDADAASGWTRGFLEFNNTDLPTLLHELSRAYNVDIQLEGVITSNTFYGSFSLKEPLEEVIQRLDFHNLHASVRRRGEGKVILTIKP